jgi:LacI family transcriptional regulator
MQKSSRRAATASDIALHLGLAPTTVSHVLAGRADRVRIKPETQQRVLEAARTLGYRPNASARAMRTGRFGCAVLVIPLGGEYLPITLVRGLTGELERQGMYLSVATVDSRALEDGAYLPKVVRELAADGLLVNLSVHVPPLLLDTIRQHRVPTVWVNNRLDADCIYPDEFAAAQRATDYLVQLGHRRIAFVVRGDRNSHFSAHDRCAGYDAAMQAAGLKSEVIDPPSGTGGGRTASLVARLSAPHPPTAFLCYEQDVAGYALLAAAQCRLSVPGDLSVLTFHDRQEPDPDQELTTISSRMEHLGEEAARLLVQKIQHPECALAPVATTSELAPGDTCGPPPEIFA